MQSLKIVFKCVNRLSGKRVDGALIRFICKPADPLSRENRHTRLPLLLSRGRSVLERTKDEQIRLM